MRFFKYFGIILLVGLSFLFLRQQIGLAERVVNVGGRPNRAVSPISEQWRLTNGKSSIREQILAEAIQQRDTMLALMQSSPEQALEQALSFSEYDELPGALKPYYAQPFSARGDLDQVWSTKIREDGTFDCQGTSIAIIDGEILKVHRDGASMGPVIKSIPMAGIRLGNTAVLRDAVAIPLSVEDVVATIDVDSTTVDPLSGSEGNFHNALHFSGKVILFENALTRARFEQAYAEKLELALEGHRATIEEPFLELISEVNGVTSELTEASPYMVDQIEVLFIRVDFPDFPGDPVSHSDLEATLGAVNAQIDNFSYGSAGLNFTVSTTCYRMPRSGESYAVAYDNYELMDDARDLAALDYTLNNYDVIGVYFPSLSEVPNSQITYSGLATVGGANHWINGINSLRVITHEFGHNYGAYHANYYHPEEELHGRYDLPEILEYSDIFDVMGYGFAPEGHFNPITKHYLGWLPDSKVAEATNGGVYTIHRFDDRSALNNSTLAVKVPMAGEVNYWLSYRQLYPSSAYNLNQGVYVVGENMGQNRETCLIDMTPESKLEEFEDRKDAGLPVGTNYYDTATGVTFRTLETGGTEPNQWIKVQVNFDPRVGVSAEMIEVDEQAGTARVSVERTHNSSGVVTVDYFTEAVSASSAVDFYPVSGTLRWADGDTDEKEISIPIRPDSTVEDREIFNLELINAVGGIVKSDSNHVPVSILEPGQRYYTYKSDVGYGVKAVSHQTDGKLVLGGSFTQVDDIELNRIARLQADGSRDSTFQIGSGFDGTVQVIVVQSDGALLVGGDFTSYNGILCNRIARLDSHGRLDTDFVASIGSGADDTVNAIAIETDGSILLGGDFSTFNGTSVKGLVRLSDQGLLDSDRKLLVPFDYFSSIDEILIEPDGKIMVIGFFNINMAEVGYWWGIARLNLDGSLDESFSPHSGAISIRTIKRLPDGKYLIGGSFKEYDGTEVNCIARIHSNGKMDPSFISSIDDPVWASVYAIDLQANGSIVAGGSFSAPEENLVKLNPSGSWDLGFTPAGGPSYSVYTVTKDDEALYLAGGVSTYEGTYHGSSIVKVASGVSPYAQWSVNNFSDAERVDGLDSSASDPDGDGLVNLVEFAMGTNPTVVDVDSIMGIADEGISLYHYNGDEYLQITLQKKGNTPGTWYAAQFGSTPNDLSPTYPKPESNAVYEVIEDSSTQYTVRDKTPISAQSSRFARVCLMLPE